MGPDPLSGPRSKRSNAAANEAWDLQCYCKRGLGAQMLLQAKPQRHATAVTVAVTVILTVTSTVTGGGVQSLVTHKSSRISCGRLRTLKANLGGGARPLKRSNAAANEC